MAGRFYCYAVSIMGCIQRLIFLEAHKLVKDDRREQFKDRRRTSVLERILWLILWAIAAGSLAVLAYKDYIGG